MREPARIIRWEEPPPPVRGQGRATPPSRYTAVAAALRERRGEWGVISQSGRGLASWIRMGAISCFSPAGDFEAVVRRIDGKPVIYARYLGEGELT